MLIGKKLRRLLATSLMISGMLIASTTNAAIQTYEGVGEYVMSDFETPDIAKQRAKAYAERDAQEKAGVYIRSYSRIENFAVTDDVIQTISVGIIKVLDSSVNVIPMNDESGSVKYRATVHVNIDTDDIDNWYKRTADEQLELVEQNRSLRQANAEQEKLIADLKRQLDSVTTDRDKIEITQSFHKAADEFLATQRLESGNRLYSQRDYRGAIRLYDEAVALNPNYAAAYVNRGSARGAIYDYQNALADYSKAIDLDPNDAASYYNRGNVYRNLNDYRRAVADYSRAIEIDPNHIAAYNNRGLSYATMYNYARARADFNKALELDPDSVAAHHNLSVLDAIAQSN